MSDVEIARSLRDLRGLRCLAHPTSCSDSLSLCRPEVSVRWPPPVAVSVSEFVVSPDLEHGSAREPGHTESASPDAFKSSTGRRGVDEVHALDGFADSPPA